MSNKKRISKKKSTSKHYELKDLERKIFFLQSENMLLKYQLALISSQKNKPNYPIGGFVGETGNEVILGKPKVILPKNNMIIGDEVNYLHKNILDKLVPARPTKK